MLQLPLIKHLSLPKLTALAALLPHVGTLAISANHLLYLKIDDDYIQQLFPLLGKFEVNEPNYFGPGGVGAHITVVYPEEKIFSARSELNREHHFEIKELAAAEIGVKKYYILLVESLSLLQLRRQYTLPDKLSFKNYAIGFHITIGVES